MAHEPERREAGVMEYSVVIPAHDEAESLPGLLRELRGVMGALGKAYEVIVVDDGSSDETLEVLRGFRGEVPELRVLALDRNWGQSAALDAGLCAAVGAVLITLDADGQNPPSEIPKVLAALEGADAVCGWRQKRNDTAWRRFCSRLANGIRRSVLNDGVHDTGCSLKAFRRECWAGVRVRLFRGLHRFLPALWVMAGFRVREVPVVHRPRERGQAHYGAWNRTFGPLMDLFAMAWMKRRWMGYRCREVGEPMEKRNHENTKG